MKNSLFILLLTMFVMPSLAFSSVVKDASDIAFDLSLLEKLSKIANPNDAKDTLVYRAPVLGIAELAVTGFRVTQIEYEIDGAGRCFGIPQFVNSSGKVESPYDSPKYIISPYLLDLKNKDEADKITNLIYNLVGKMRVKCGLDPFGVGF